MTGAPITGAAGGFTVVELMASMAIALTVCGALFTLLDAARRTAASSAEVGELQQRLRAGLHLVADELLNAGAGPDRTRLAGPLGFVFPPVVPYRRGQVADDAQAGVTFRPDVLSLAYVSSSQAQAEVAATVDLGGRLRVELRPNCGPLAPVAVCGFVDGMRVVLLEPSGAHDFVTVEDVAGSGVELSYRGQLMSTYAMARRCWPTRRPHLRAADTATGIPQLTHYDGFLTERPAVDHVVALSFEYLGEAEPPRLRPGAEPGVTAGPWTTYGPAPPPIGVDDPSTAWSEGENCTFVVADGRHQPRLAVLGPPGDLVPIDAGVLGDGPWCPDANAARPYDADLLRIRQVRIRVRAEAAPRAMRGAAGAFFTRGGVASAGAEQAPDQEAVLDIVPRNLATRR